MRAFLISVLALAGCSDDAQCGPELGSLINADAEIIALGDSRELRFGPFVSSPNNDCGETGGPVSLTLEAQQEGQSFGITMCLPRPDKLSGRIALPADDRVQFIDIFADLGAGCMASLNRDSPVLGSVEFFGVCDDGLYEDGYSLRFDISASIDVTCPEENNQTGLFSLNSLVFVEAASL